MYAIMHSYASVSKDTILCSLNSLVNHMRNKDKGHIYYFERYIYIPKVYIYPGSSSYISWYILISKRNIWAWREQMVCRVVLCRQQVWWRVYKVQYTSTLHYSAECDSTWRTLPLGRTLAPDKPRATSLNTECKCKCMHLKYRCHNIMYNAMQVCVL